MSQSECYRKQNRISRKPKRSLLPGVLCALVALLILMLLWTMPTEDVALQTELAEDFSQTEVSIEEELAATDEKTTVINSSNNELNTPGVNGVAAEKNAKKKKNKKESSEEETSSSKKKSSKNSKKTSEESEGTSASKGASTGSSGSSKGATGKSSSTTDADVAVSGGGSSTSGDKGSIPSSSGGSSGTMVGTSSDGGSSGSTSKKSTSSANSSGSAKVYADSTGSADETEAGDVDAAAAASDAEGDPAVAGDVDASASVETSSAAASSAEEQADAAADEHDIFDYSGWGFSTYSAFVQEHPIRARLTYARLWTLRFLSTAQPVGCTSCSKLDESVPEKVTEVERPQSGQIFEVSGQGAMPQLVVVAPEDQDAFVKLKRDDGEVVLSFYVRSGTVVKACVPVGECSFYYALGTDWKGEEELFGSEGVYAKSDRTLNFTTPLNSYEYRFGVENGNVTPKSISMAAF